MSHRFGCFRLQSYREIHHLQDVNLLMGCSSGGFLHVVW